MHISLHLNDDVRHILGVEQSIRLCDSKFFLILGYNTRLQWILGYNDFFSNW